VQDGSFSKPPQHPSSRVHDVVALGLLVEQYSYSRHDSHTLEKSGPLLVSIDRSICPESPIHSDPLAPSSRYSTSSVAFPREHH
jgi:hypothetical protein